MDCRSHVFIAGLLILGFVFILAEGQVYGQEGLTAAAVRQEKLEIIEEFSASANSLLIPDQTYTPVNTFKGVTYVVWVSPDRYPMVAKIDGKKTTTERLDDNDGYKVFLDGHHKFSMGIDNDGYIHITGDMHHHPMFNTGHLAEPYKSSHCMYWVSDKPEDISSFTFMGNDDERTIQGTSFSYHYFDNDNNGVLYFMARVRTNVVNQGPGRMGYGMQKYDTKTKRWTSLGAVPEGNHLPVIAWEDNGKGGGGYQAMRGDIRFDKNNRLHFVTTINADNSQNPNGKAMTHVIYAYSDDGGVTFHKADGTLIASLPMRVEDGPDQADVVAGPVHWISMPTSVAFTRDNAPFVYYIDISGRDQAKYTQWNVQAGWSVPADLPLNATSWDRQYNDGRGVITLSSLRRGFYRTANLKEEGVRYNTPFFCIDRRYLADTGELRGLSSSRNKIKVVRLKTSLPTVPR